MMAVQVKGKASNEVGRITDRALLATVHFRSWGGEKEDKEASRDVIEKAGAQEGAAKVKKILLSKQALANYKKVRGEAMAAHYSITLPWADDGYRVLPSAKLFEYRSLMGEYRQRIEDIADVIEREYPSYIEEAKDLLGDLFDPKDYPDPGKIRQKFGMSVGYRPIPESRDFRLDLGQADLDAVVQATEAEIKQGIETAVFDLVRRMKEVVTRVKDRLESYEPGKKGQKGTTRLHDTVITSVQDIVDLVPALNITGDQRIEQIAKEMEKELCQYRTEELRHLPRIRKETAEAAQEILEKMQGYGF